MKKDTEQTRTNAQAMNIRGQGRLLKPSSTLGPMGRTRCWSMDTHVIVTDGATILRSHVSHPGGKMIAEGKDTRTMLRRNNKHSRTFEHCLVIPVLFAKGLHRM